MKRIHWQLALVAALSFALGRASLNADEPPAVVASLPAEGQPPAPAIDEPVPQPAVPQPAVAEPAAPPVAASAEVVSDAQVEAIAEKPTADEVRELSVEPVTETRPMLPADRPAWVGAANDTSERVHRLFVASFTANTREAVEADDMLDDPMVAAVERYLQDTLFPHEKLGQLPITPEFVRNNLLDKSTSYVAAMTTQSGTEYQKWVVLQITPEQRQYFAEQQREHKQRERMAMLGVGLAGVLGMTGLANLAFNRRRRRYPNTMTPVSMAIMPGHGDGAHAFQQVAVGGSPHVVLNAPPKKRSFFGKVMILMAVGLICALVLPVITFTKVTSSTVREADGTEIKIHGKNFDIKVHRPLMERILSEHD